MLFLNYKFNIKILYYRSCYTDTPLAVLQGGLSAKNVPIPIPSIRTITIANKKIIAPTIYNSIFDFATS